MRGLLAGVMLGLVACVAADGSEVSTAGVAIASNGEGLVFHERPWEPDLTVAVLSAQLRPDASAPMGRAWHGLRLAMPTSWSGTPYAGAPRSFPFAVIALHGSAASALPPTAELAMSLYHRPAGSNLAWQNLHCLPSGPSRQWADEHYRAEYVAIDLTMRDIDLTPATPVPAPGTAPSPRAEQTVTFQSCGVLEPDPEFSAFVFPYSTQTNGSVARVDYEMEAWCDDFGSCPAPACDPASPSCSTAGWSEQGGCSMAEIGEAEAQCGAGIVGCWRPVRHEPYQALCPSGTWITGPAPF